MGRRRLGRLRRMKEQSITTTEQFWNHVDKNGPVIYPKIGRCWLWTGPTGRTGRTGRTGYGRFQVAPYTTQPAHRVSLEMSLGRKLLPSEMACHHCDNPPCVRPDHLFVGDALTNMQDRDAKGRGWGRTRRSDATRAKMSAAVRARLANGYIQANARKTHCKRGHEFTEENTRRINGTRVCRTCDRQLHMARHHGA